MKIKRTGIQSGRYQHEIDEASRRAKRGYVIVAFIVATLFLGCGVAPNPELFAEFAKTTADIRDNGDEILAAQARWAEDRFVERVATAPNDSLLGEMIIGLLLDPVPGKPYEWSVPENAPLFVTARAFQRDVFELTDALVDYADLLLELSGAASISEDELKARVESMNGDLDRASRALGDKLSGSSLAFFSVGASEMIEQYLQSQRRKELAQALSDNQ
jgi:hypothetical protein